MTYHSAAAMVPRRHPILLAVALLAGIGACERGGGSSDGRLAFESTPATVKAGEILPPVTVLVQSSSGRLDKSSKAEVTLFLEANPPGATLSGTVTVNAVKGVATFPDLSINRASAYQLAAFSGDRIPAVSDVFVIAPPSGALEPVAGSPYSIGTSPAAVAIDPTGSFLYASASEGIYAFGIEAGGALTSIPGSPFTQGQNPISIAVDSSGRFVYATNQFSSTISGWAIGSAGALSAIPGTSGIAFGPRIPIVADPTGKRFFAGANGAGVAAWTYDVTGAASQAPGSPFTSSGNPLAMAVDPSGQFLCVAGSFGDVQSFGIAANGVLTPVTGTVVGGPTPRAMAIDHTGSFVYVADETSFDVSAFAIAVDGSLTTIAGSPFYVGQVGRVGLATHPLADFLYVVSNDNVVRAFAIDASGAFDFFFSTPLRTDGPNTAIGIDPQGEHVFVTSNGPAGGQLWVYSVVP